MNIKSFCIKRINKDIKEIMLAPLEGIGIVSLDNDPMKYIVNIRLLSGIYEGYCIQLLLTFSENYPIKPPKILIYPCQLLDNTYHHHIFKDDKLDEKGKHFNKLCLDLLDNDFLSTSSQYTGWNPSYTISSFLLQVQTFLSEPDMPESHLPSKEKINELMKSLDDYEKVFIIKKDGDDIYKTHTWKYPYPKIYCKNVKNEKDTNKNEENKKLTEIKEDLTCYISKLNYIDDNSLLLGYPIKITYSGDYIPIPEILSYDSYIEELSKKNEGEKRYNFFNFNDLVQDINTNNEIFMWRRIVDTSIGNFITIPTITFIDRFFGNTMRFKSANNEYYNSWLPIFVNENHFQKNETTILNFFSILKYGNSGLEKYDFQRQYIFEIMPNLLFETLNKMAIENISSKLLNCFFQYIFLYEKLIEKNKDFFNLYQNYYLYKNKYDILQCKRKINYEKLIIDLFFLFFYHQNKLNLNLKTIFGNYLRILKNSIYLGLFELYPLDFKNHNVFISELKKFKLFYKIVDIIFLDKEFLNDNYMTISEISRNKIIKAMNNNFKKLYLQLDAGIKNEIRKILINNLDLSKYFDFNSLNFYYNMYIWFKVPLTNIYNIWKTFLLFYIFKRKIYEKGVLKSLGNNYGIYLEAEDFIKEIHKELQKSNETFKDIFSNYNCLNHIKEIIILYYYLKEPYIFIDRLKINNDHIMKKKSFFGDLKDTLKEINVLMREENEAMLRNNRSYIRLKRQFSKEEKYNNDIKSKIKQKKIKIKFGKHKIYSKDYKKKYR